MNKKKKPLILLALAAMLLLTACGKIHSDSDIWKKLAKELESAAKDTSEEEAENEEGEDFGDSDDPDNPAPDTQPPALEIEIKTDYLSEYNGQVALCRSQFQTLQINSQDYPELARSLEEFNQKSSDEVTETYNQLLADARSSYNSSPSPSFSAYTCNRELQVVRADSSVLSFWVSDADYYGGPHGYSSRTGKNYDVNTGAVLNLEDVITDTSRLPDLIVEKLLAENPPETFFAGFEETIENEFRPGSSVSPNWTLDYTGITFHFDPYEITTFADGAKQATLVFTQYPDLFKEPYKEPVHQFASNVEFYYDLFLDLDEDGSTEKLCLIPSMPSDSFSYYRCQLTIRFNGLETMTSCDGELVSAFLARMADGRCYLYAQAIGDSDMSTIYVFHLVNGAFSFVGEYYESFYNSVVNNPERFKLTRDLDALSTYSGYRYYAIGSTGMPEPLEETYTVISYPESPGHYLTAKIPVPVWMISSDGAVDSEATYLPAGTVLYFRKTDGTSFVEMELQDGRHCQVRFNASGWPRTIEGRDESEWFDGIMYAG